MARAHFVKVNEGITWNKILELSQNQINNSIKSLEYISIAELILKKEDFQDIKSCISCPHPSFISLAEQSITGSNGIWKCITIHCDFEIHDIIIYTSGRTIPLYVAIIEKRRDNKFM